LYLKGDMRVFCEEHLKLADTDPEVTICEVVWNVETKRSKLPSLYGNSMEESNGEEKVLELVDLNIENHNNVSN